MLFEELGLILSERRRKRVFKTAKTLKLKNKQTAQYVLNKNKDIKIT